MTRKLLLLLPLLATAAAISCFAANITTRDGTIYRNAQVTGVDPDGIRVTHSTGVAKLRFEDLPEALQKQYHYDAAKVAAYRKQVEDAQKAAAAQAAVAQQNKARATATPQATDARGAEELLADAESALRRGEFVQSADLLNRIASQYPNSHQAGTVRDLASFLRDRQGSQNGPITVSEAERLRSLMDALDNIRTNYRTATPEKRRALEAIFGRDTFQRTDTGLDSLSTSAVKLRGATDRALQEQR